MPSLSTIFLREWRLEFFTPDGHPGPRRLRRPVHIKTVEMKARKAAPRGYSRIIMEYKKDLPVRMVLEEFGGISTEYLFTY